MKRPALVLWLCLSVLAVGLPGQEERAPGEILLDKLSAMFESFGAGTLQQAVAFKTLDGLEAEAAKAFKESKIPKFFFDRYGRLLKFVRLLMTTPSTDAEKAMADKEIGRFVEDILGETWDPEASASTQIRQCAEAVAGELTSLELDLKLPAEDPESDSTGPPPLRIREDDLSFVRGEKPVYPEKALKKRSEGTVILDVVLDVRGKVKDVRVIRSLPDLDQAAVDAVKGWTYEPYLLDGKPREVIFTTLVKFTLH